MLFLTGVSLLAAYLHWQPLAVQACRAVDGDTIHCGEQRVRLAGMDAPELRARCAEERALALAATERLRGLIAEGVTIQPAGRDKYDRVLAIVRDRQGLDVADTLIREGLAVPYHGRGQRADWC